jgi:hypothetical protein
MEKTSRSEHVRNEVFHSVKEDTNILHTRKEGRLTGLVISCIGNAFSNTFLKER